MLPWSLPVCDNVENASSGKSSQVRWMREEESFGFVGYNVPKLAWNSTAL
jgi:hypothetical protein